MYNKLQSTQSEPIGTNLNQSKPTQTIPSNIILLFTNLFTLLLPGLGLRKDWWVSPSSRWGTERADPKLWLSGDLCTRRSGSSRDEAAAATIITSMRSRRAGGGTAEISLRLRRAVSSLFRFLSSTPAGKMKTKFSFSSQFHTK